MRAVGVFLGAVIISFATDAILRHFLTPGLGQLMIRMYATTSESKQWDEIWRQWHHVNLISVFVLAPVAGFAGGAFVGLLQKRHATLIAVCTQIPELFFQLWADRTNPWAHSLYGAASSLSQHLLPVVAAMLGAVLLHRAVTSRRSSTPEAPATATSRA
jgi:hypothetical protein